MSTDENKIQRAEISTALPDKKELYEKLYSVIEENQKKAQRHLYPLQSVYLGFMSTSYIKKKIMRISMTLPLNSSV